MWGSTSGGKTSWAAPPQFFPSSDPSTLGRKTPYLRIVTVPGPGQYILIHSTNHGISIAVPRESFKIIRPCALCSFGHVLFEMAVGRPANSAVVDAVPQGVPQEVGKLSPGIADGEGTNAPFFTQVDCSSRSCPLGRPSRLRRTTRRSTPSWRTASTRSCSSKRRRSRPAAARSPSSSSPRPPKRRSRRCAPRRRRG